MKTKIFIIAVLCFALAACGNNSRKNQNRSAQETESVPQEPAVAEPAIAGAEDIEAWEYYSAIDSTMFIDTLQFVGNYGCEDGFSYEFFLTKDFEILQMSPMEDPFEDGDENKLFVVFWQKSMNPDKEGRRKLHLTNREEIPGAQPYVTRRHYSQDDGYTNVFEDTYKGKTLKDVYGFIVRNEWRFNYHLREKLPAGNTDYKSDERGENVEVSYRFKTRKHLTIELNYAGGITTVEIAESSGKTVSKISYSAD